MLCSSSVSSKEHPRGLQERYIYRLQYIIYSRDSSLQYIQQAAIQLSLLGGQALTEFYLLLIEIWWLNHPLEQDSSSQIGSSPPNLFRWNFSRCLNFKPPPSQSSQHIATCDAWDPLWCVWPNLFGVLGHLLGLPWQLLPVGGRPTSHCVLAANDLLTHWSALHFDP